MVLLQNVTDTPGTNLTCADTRQKGHGASQMSCPQQRPNHTVYFRVTCCECAKCNLEDLSTVLTQNYSLASQRGFNLRQSDVLYLHLRQGESA